MSEDPELRHLFKKVKTGFDRAIHALEYPLHLQVVWTVCFENLPDDSIPPWKVAVMDALRSLRDALSVSHSGSLALGFYESGHTNKAIKIQWPSGWDDYERQVEGRLRSLREGEGEGHLVPEEEDRTLWRVKYSVWVLRLDGLSDACVALWKVALTRALSSAESADLPLLQLDVKSKMVEARWPTGAPNYEDRLEEILRSMKNDDDDERLVTEEIAKTEWHVRTGGRFWQTWAVLLDTAENATTWREAITYALETARRGNLPQVQHRMATETIVEIKWPARLDDNERRVEKLLYELRQRQRSAGALAQEGDGTVWRVRAFRPRRGSRFARNIVETGEGSVGSTK